MVYEDQYYYQADLEDYIYNNGVGKFEQFAVFRQVHFAGLRCIPEIVNEFGMNGGF